MRRAAGQMSEAGAHIVRAIKGQMVDSTLPLVRPRLEPANRTRELDYFAQTMELR